MADGACGGRDAKVQGEGTEDCEDESWSATNSTTSLELVEEEHVSARFCSNNLVGNTCLVLTVDICICICSFIVHNSVFSVIRSL
ncbi:hypothetical protein LIER_41609 [Lithospermum erythrorhizon]|uniref:Uncharacterized protein n=1 Tax=Lithospermum erythrorhizon TaxID=34254 RepID=A0AAV3RBU7_LITER